MFIFVTYIIPIEMNKNIYTFSVSGLQSFIESIPNKFDSIF